MITLAAMIDVLKLKSKELKLIQKDMLMWKMVSLLIKIEHYPVIYIGMNR